MKTLLLYEIQNSNWLYIHAQISTICQNRNELVQIFLKTNRHPGTMLGRWPSQKPQVWRWLDLLLTPPQSTVESLNRPVHLSFIQIFFFCLFPSPLPFKNWFCDERQKTYCMCTVLQVSASSLCPPTLASHDTIN